MPTDATTKNSVTAPMRGARTHNPPMFDISRVCRRSCSAPAIMNSAAVEKPCAIMVTTAPLHRQVVDDQDPGGFVEGENAKQDKTHVGDRTVCDQPLEVRLAVGHETAVKNAQRTEEHGPDGKVGRGLREQRHHEANQTVRAGLQQDAGEYDAAGGGRLGVRVRQPGVERHARQLDDEGDKEPEHHVERHIAAKFPRSASRSS